MNLSNLNITPDLLKYVAEIDEFKGAWNIYHNLSPERLQSLRQVATIESIGSSTRIEGVKLSDEEIESLLGGIGKQSFATRDEQEVVGYAELMERVFESYEEIEFSENYIKQLHSILLRHSIKDQRHRGEYKTNPNDVSAFDQDGKNIGTVFETTTPFDTPFEMQKLVSWTRESLEDKSFHPLIILSVFIVTFLAIHPFQDGNGRLSRILTTLLLLKSGYHYIPYSSLESIIENNKDAYYLALRRTQKTHKSKNIDWYPWLSFFLLSLKRQKDHLLSKIELSNQHSELSSDQVIILEYVKKNKRITTSEATELLDIPRPTVKKRLTSLVNNEWLELHGKGRGSRYSLKTKQ